MHNNETIAGCVRRIRKILKPEGHGRVSADYGELMKAFDHMEFVASVNYRKVSEVSRDPKL